MRRSIRAQRPSHARQRFSQFGDAQGFGDAGKAPRSMRPADGSRAVGTWTGGFGDADHFGDAGGFWLERRAKRR